MALIDTPELATRLARAIASDISLYNEAKIVAGIQNDNLFESLDGELAEGRELYKSRINPDLYARSNFFDRAVVDIIVRGKGHVKSRIW
jgi:spore germination protein GerM